MPTDRPTEPLGGLITSGHRRACRCWPVSRAPTGSSSCRTAGARVTVSTGEWFIPHQVVAAHVNGMWAPRLGVVYGPAGLRRGRWTGAGIVGTLWGWALLYALPEGAAYGIFLGAAIAAACMLSHRAQAHGQMLPALREKGWWSGESQIRNFQTGKPIDVVGDKGRKATLREVALRKHQGQVLFSVAD